MRSTTLGFLHQVCADMVQLAGFVRQDTNDVVATDDHIAIITHYDKIRIAREQIKTAREALEQIEDNLSKEIIPTVMKNHGVKTITIEGVGRCTVSYRYSCSLLDREAGFKWLRDTGNESLITETVNSSTLSAFAKNRIEEEGKDMPDEIFKVGTAPYTSITKK